MAMGGRGNSLQFGKISLASEIESMDSLITHLGTILRDYGYPEKKVEESEGYEDKDLAEEEAKLSDMMSNGNSSQQ